MDISSAIKKRKRYLYDIETTGLDVFEHRVTCISTMDAASGEIKSFLGEDEKKLLEDFWDSIKDAKLLIGFNNHGFDWPFLLRRSLFYNVRIVKAKNLDLRKEASGFWEHYERRISGKLLDYLIKLGVKPKTDGGSKMPKKYIDGKWNEIQDHCEEDIKLLKVLYDRLKSCHIIKEK